MHKQPMVLFVRGAPRTGTTLLEELLNQRPDVAIMLEYPFERMAQQMLPILLYDDSLEIHLKVSADPAGPAGRRAVPYPTPERYPAILKAVLEATFEKTDLKIIGSKTPGHSSGYQMGLVRTLFSDVRYIFCVRNPLDTINSSLHRREMTKAGRDSWHIGTVEAAVNEYRENMALLRSHADRFPKDCFVVGYERMVESPEETLSAVSEFLGVEIRDGAGIVAPSNREFVLSEQERAYVRSEFGHAIDAWPHKRTVGLAAEIAGDFDDCLQSVIPGRDYLFLRAQNDRSMLGAGWSVLEEEGVWSDDSAADLQFVVDRTADYQLTLALNAYVPHQGAQMPLTLEFDGEPILQCVIDDSHVFELRVNLMPCNAGRHTVRFRFSALRSPAERGLSTDYRRLGVHLRKFALTHL